MTAPDRRHGPVTFLGQLDERHLIRPRVMPPLDPAFRPAALAAARFFERVRESPSGRPVWLAVEQPGGAVSHHQSWACEDGPNAASSARFVERDLKFLLWSRGGSRVYVDGPASLVATLDRHFTADPVGLFDAGAMGSTIYGAPFEVLAAPHSAFPGESAASLELGGHLDGCRIGFDLGASDRKVAAVIDGVVCFSEETSWDPRHQADPQWHFQQVNESLRRAADHLPRVDAIGGSSAGVFVNSEPRLTSLFRAVPRDLFESRARHLFHELQHAWGDVPLVVVNDGDVTALAGAMSAGVGALLGIAMGSSEAGGYITSDGRLTSWLNELAFAPVDLSAGAPRDEWSGDSGVGAQYFSQQAVARLLPAAGIDVPDDLDQPSRLVELQRLMAEGDPRAHSVYETIGAYLGYGLLQYARFYRIEHLLLLGRVTTGSGGEVIQETAEQVLDSEQDLSSAHITFHTASERDKRHGQAVVAASLPRLR
jgi:predicted NBD/HSP70 family sugar kinase